MNIIERAKQLARGVEVIHEWLGEGGSVATYPEAQSRAITCLKCPQNVKGWTVAQPVAMAIKRHLEVKNALNLSVQGERKLGTCGVCGCFLRLSIWESGDRIKKHMTEEEIRNSPDNCWKKELV